MKTDTTQINYLDTGNGYIPMIQITNKQYMRTLLHIILGLSLLAFIASCGGAESTESKKAKLEKLKASQMEIADQIKALELDLQNSGDTSNQVKKMKDVMVVKLEPRVFTHSIDVQGRVEGDENVTVTVKMAGTINRLAVTAGSSVKAGQVMAEIDNEAMQAQMADLKNSYELAKDMYNKQKALWDQKVGTEMQYLQAKSTKESLEQKIRQLQETLEMYKIKAPFSGTVDEVSVKLGQTVGPGMPAIRVVNLQKLKVRADLAEAYSSKVQIGNTVNLFFPDINKTTVSKVAYSGKVINIMTRTFTVDIDLPSDNTYRPNMVSQVSIVDYTSNNAITVPVNTVQNIDNKNYVYVATSEKGMQVARKREVLVGEIYNGIAEIKSGLNPGDLLISTGFSNLNDGELLKF